MDKSNRKSFLKAMNDKSPTYISSDAVAISFQSRILKVEKDHLVLKNTVPPEYITAVMNGDKFFFQISMIRYESNHIASNGADIIYPISEASLVKEVRQVERFSFSQDEKVICEILNPFDMETRISKPVLDMSAYGLSFRTTFDSELIRPGTNLPEIKIMIDGEPYKSVSGEVMYHRRLMSLQGKLRIQVGIRFHRTEDIP